MKILWICKRFYTNHDLIIDRFGRNYHLPVLLKEAGFDVSVAAADYRRKSSESVVIEQVEFTSFPLGIFGIAKYMKMMKTKIRDYGPDVVVASGDTHFGYIGWILSRSINIPFVFDVYDHYPSFGTNRIPGMGYLYHYALKHADLVMCVSANLEKYIAAYNKNIIRIENGVDMNVFHPMDRSACRKNLSIGENENVIGYFGSMEKMRGIDTLVNSCLLLSEKYGIKLRLLLAGVKPETLNFEYDWIDYRGVISQQEIAVLLNACSVVVLPYNREQQIYYANSCKIAEYFSCRVPIVSTRVEDFISNYPKEAARLGEAICEPGDPVSMSKSIRFQLENQLVIFPESNLDWNSNARKLINGIQSLFTAGKIT